ncbi:CaiB/BaiF CoA transferase family protein [Pseudonocardia asaccharolytica]|uniref:CoA transferase n=1 Tax=Pseudonocardia asaccharolytica DSM 44247 = NBRC 16224 TaxID=1123024 RepID=A0A511DA74_9PSEU|nr:CoA transferase [Pseudonocardia asaccharolytica]GEL19848.1 CoA transferase [Pseudonocardia asaccharolytica DSM 44247 = NBRC 16224]
MTGERNGHSATVAGPLAGYLVVDLSRALAGPHAAMMLGDLGARVVKLEQPGTGDESRTWGPPFVGERDSTYFLACNRNKESVVLDLKSAQDRDTLDALVARADVLIENFRPGVLDRLGFGTEELRVLNPGLVVLSISGFGHDGPERARPGYDQIAQGEAGLMSLTGPPDRPMRVGVPIGDLLAGIYGAFGVVAALAERERTGEGRMVRTSLLSGIVGAHAFQGTRATVAGEVPSGSGNHHPTIAPYGAFQCADGYVQVAVGNEGQWRVFASAVGLDPDDERFAGNADRLANHDLLVDAVERAWSDLTRDACLERLTELGVPSGRVRTLDEVYAWAQTRSQGLLLELTHRTAGPITLPGPAVRMEDLHERNVLRREHLPPPTLGEHTGRVLEWLSDPTADRRCAVPADFTST